MIPKITTEHGSETRNIINKAIETINVHGKTLQELAIEEQLTEEQYAALLGTLQGLVRKGELTIDDIDFNEGKLEQIHLSDELLQMIAGEAEINAVPADGSITFNKLDANVEKAIKGSILEEGININDLTTEGLHFISRGSAATEELNFPPGDHSGVLEVRNIGLGIITQLYTMHNMGEMWTRRRYAGSWSQWRAVGRAFTEASSLGTTDLNELVTNGIYRQLWTTNVNDELNYPPVSSESKIGALYVTSSSSGTGTQMYVADNAGEIWVRNYFEEWGEWKRIGDNLIPEVPGGTGKPVLEMEVTGRWTPNDAGDDFLHQMGGHELVEVIQIGHSVQERPLYAAVIGDPSKPAVYAMCAAHGTEVGAAEAGWMWIKALTEEKTLMFQDICVIVLPNQNPDNRFNARGNKNAVDLIMDWVDRSQPETKAAEKILNDYNVVAVIDVHNFGYPEQVSLRPTSHGPESVQINSEKLYDEVFQALENDGQPVRRYNPQSEEGSLHWGIPEINEIPTLLLEIPCGGYADWTFDHYYPTPSWQAYAGVLACNAFARYVWRNLDDFVSADA